MDEERAGEEGLYAGRMALFKTFGSNWFVEKGWFVYLIAHLHYFEIYIILVTNETPLPFVYLPGSI